ncbi:hypothetical protein CXF85_08360 [Colwellia sp. 75C3]|uniref:hypothetical protein n=1 Tax=Colwellia sp. 75C3 TaxID=888425 RepID=UPI000C343073|nr:hypothetical protein [Colwellia sp. 75C3]PKG84468.1 hypothetical protein CXF85_08360 [Colwellia sp. 75C3]
MVVKPVIGNFIWNIIEKFLRALFMLLINVLLVASYSYEKFGEYAFSLIVVNLLSVGVSFGFSQSGNSEIIGKRGVPCKQKIGKIFVTKLWVLCFVLSATIFIAIMYEQPFLVYLIGLLALPLSETFEYRLNFHGKSKSYVKIKVLLLLSGFGCKFIALELGVGLEAIGIITSIEAILILVIYYISLPRLKFQFYSWFDFSLARKMLPIALASSIVIVFNQIDILFIKGEVNLYSIGLYITIAQLCNTFAIIPVLLNSAVQGQLRNTQLKNKLIFHSYIKRLFILYSFFGISISLLLYKYGDIIYGVFYQSNVEYSHLIVDVFGIYSMSVMFFFVSVFINMNLVLRSMNSIILLKNIFSVIIALILLSFFVDGYSLKGAAFSFVLAQLLGQIILPLLVIMYISKKID